MKNVNTILIFLLVISFYQMFKLQFKLINLKLLNKRKIVPVQIRKSNNRLPINIQKIATKCNVCCSISPVATILYALCAIAKPGNATWEYGSEGRSGQTPEN